MNKIILLIRKNEKKLLIASFLYIIAVCLYMLVHRSWFSPDQFFVFALFGSLIAGRVRMFIFDWIPFIFFFLGYEFLRGIVPHIIGNVHIFGMIKIDTFLFGYLPTTKFQTLFNPTNLQWYDYLTVTLYISYFVVPMLVGYYLWIRDRKLFKKYSIAFLVLTYACFVTFILFPAMPPWMAAAQGYLPPVKEVISVVMAHFLPQTVSIPTLYSLVAADPVAAVPSLHAAVPMLIFLFMVKKHNRIGFIFLLYVVGIWFSVIYLGEHYFIDVIVGMIYAIFAFLIVDKWSVIKMKLKNLSLLLATS